MTSFLQTLLQIRKDTLPALKALDGTLWEASSGELHLQYNEMPNWIIIRPDADLRAAHRAFVEIFTPYFTRMLHVNVTVSYTTPTDTGSHQLAFLNTNEEVLAALADPAFGC